MYIQYAVFVTNTFRTKIIAQIQNTDCFIIIMFDCGGLSAATSDILVERNMDVLFNRIHPNPEWATMWTPTPGLTKYVFIIISYAY